MTHLKAKRLFKEGKIAEAWRVAQEDDGWNDNITFPDWNQWMKGLVA